MTEPETLRLAAGPHVPNNTLPVLVYRGAGPQNGSGMLRLFGRNGWGNGWRNGIYPFHHFHSTAHEVLGIARGAVTVRLGGETGQDVTLEAGDVVVLPAGTGHKRLSDGGELEVVGAYPEGSDYDLIRADDVDDAALSRAIATIGALPCPRTDPVVGENGPLTRLWTGVKLG